VAGGLGSIGGAFIAALLIGLVHAFGTALFPQATLVVVFLTMAVVLVLKPQGIGGLPAALLAPLTPPGKPPRSFAASSWDGFGRACLARCFCCWLAWPGWAGRTGRRWRQTC
jgi:branched-chain amino acid transport system permease protein